MSATIDQRVVEMRFDNKQFESGVSTTMSTLDKLKKSLNLKGASQGFEQLSSATDETRKSLDQFEYASYKTGFSWRDVLHKISSVAEWNIARQAISSVEGAIKRLGDSLLGITAMKTGFSEYETQIGAIQTILANTESKGTTLDDVNKALDELNTYADKTIYNFTEMTRNIGTFTAAGVELDTSVQAIKGIANLAAVSGSTSQQASTAMYQLSQAMASGTVKLMDWNSVVNAGMGGQVFQDALKETARVHGIAIDDIINKQGSFRESLSEGWLTTEILTDTLAKFTGDLSEEQLKAQGYTDEQIKGIMKLGQTANDAATKVKTFTQLFDTLKEAAQSGWSQTWEILVGDFEEAKELLTQVSDVIGGMIGASAESRNELLENWKVLGGRQDLIDSFANVFKALMSVITPIKDAFREIFPPMTAEQLVKFTEGLKNLTSKLILSDESSANLKRTFKGLFTILKVAVNIISAVFKAVGTLLGGIDGLGGGLLGVTAFIGDCISAFGDLVMRSNIFGNVLQGVAKVIRFVLKIATSFFNFITESLIFPGLEALGGWLEGLFVDFGNVGDAAGELKDNVSDAFKSMGAAIENCALFKMVSALWKGIKGVASAVGNFFGKIFGGFFDMLGNADFEGILDLIERIISGGIGVAIIKFINSLANKKSSLEDLAGSVRGLLDSLTGSFKAFQNALNAEALLKIAGAIAILAASALVLSFINKDKLADSISAILLLMGGLMGIIGIAGKTGGFGALAGSTAQMMGIAISVLVLASALKKLEGLDVKEIGVGISGVIGLTASLVIALRALTTSKDKAMVQGVMQMIGLAYAIKMLANALKDIADLDWTEFGIGIVGLTGVMALLVGAMKILPLGTKNIARPFYKFMAQMIVVCKAAQMMANTLADIAYLEWDELAVGITGLTGIMTLLVGSMAIFNLFKDTDLLKGDIFGSKSTNWLGIAAALMALAVSVRILVPAIETLGGMDWTALGKAGAVFAALLATLAIFSLETKLVNSDAITKTAWSIMIVSGSLLLLAASFKIFGGMSWDALGKAGSVLAAITGVIALLALESKLVSPGAINAMAASLAIIAASLQMLLPVILALSLMSWDGLGKTGAFIGGLVLVLAGLGAVSKFINPGNMAVLGASLAIMAVSLQMLTAPLLILELVSWPALAKGLALIVGAFTALGIAGLLLKSLAPVILTFAGSLALLGAGVYLVGTGIGILGLGLVGLAAGLTALGASIVALVGYVPKLIEVFLVGIARALVGVCDVIAQGAPTIGKAIAALIVMLCDVIIECVPVIVDTILVLIVELLKSLSQYAPTIVDSLLEFLVLIIGSLSNFVPSLVESIFDIVIAILDGVADNIPKLFPSIIRIIEAIFQGAADALKNIDTGILVEGILAIGLLAGLVAALAAIAPMIPAAMLGAVGLIPIVAELSVVLGLIGAIMGSKTASLVKKSGKILKAIGIAIGSFIGGLVGGIVQGVASILPEIATCLSEFMTNIQPFLDGIRSIDGSILTGILYLSAAIALMGVTSLLTKKSGLEGLTTFTFAAAALSAALLAFSMAAQYVNPSACSAAAEACVYLAAAVAVMGVAMKLNKSNSNDWVSFGGSVATMGVSLLAFSLAAENINPDAVARASIAAGFLSAAVAIMGAASFLTSLKGVEGCATFGLSVLTLGLSLRSFYECVSGVEPVVVERASIAAGFLSAAVAIMGAASFLTSLKGVEGCATFAASVLTLGTALWGFYELVQNIEPVVVERASISAGFLSAAVAIMGAASLLTSLTSISGCATFGLAVLTLGSSLWGFYELVQNIEPVVVERASISAGFLSAAVAIMGVASLLTSLTNIAGCASFGAAVLTLGASLWAFYHEVEGVDPLVVEKASIAAGFLSAAVAIMGAASLLTSLTNIVGCASFAGAVVTIGASMLAFYHEVKDIAPEPISAAASAANDLSKAVMSMGVAGIVAAIGNIVAAVGYLGAVTTIGAAMAAFSWEVQNVKPTEIKAAAEAAPSLVDAVIAMTGGGVLNAIGNFFTAGGANKSFKNAVTTIGEAIAGFSEKVQDISSSKVAIAADAAGDISKIIKEMPSDASSKLDSFSTSLSKFGGSLTVYYSLVSTITKEGISASANAISSIQEISKVDTGKISAVSDAVNKIADSIKELANVPKDSASTFTKALKDLGKQSVKAFTKEFDDLGDDLKKIAKKAMDAFIEGINDKKDKAIKAFKKVAEECAEAIEDKKNSFKNAGKALAQGLADGISANSYKAEAKAKAMAEAAAEAARKALDINSPSKVFRALGYSIPEGLAAGIDKLSGMAKNSAVDMADESIKGVKNSIARISDAINSDIDAQPTIRPVLDLSDVKSGASAIGSMLGAGASVDVLANVGAINSMMSQRNQNGGNSDVISAINTLGKDIRDSKGDTYNFGDISYDDESSIAEAVQALVRAAIMERRV